MEVPEADATGTAVPASTRSGKRPVKRSVTIRPDIDQAVLQSVGEREYSRFATEALLMALQAKGIEQTVADLEARTRPLSADEFTAADLRRAEALQRTLARLSIAGTAPSA